jgi:acetylornithine deacetylase/succinyl-diaminopimelate desuccinylase-like protein
MIDWQAIRHEVTGYLQDLIRFDTTNPPGNETQVATYLADVLRREGLKPTLVESTPGRGNVIARLTGGPEPPLLLLGHTDVVACEPDQWTRPPFGGELYDDYIWGRGALDMKNMVAAELMVLLLIKRQGLQLNRDLLYAATADEEAGKGNHGPGWILDHHPGLLEAPFILTEGGGHDVDIGGRRFYTCQVGQKGICRMRLHTNGRPGHGSIPHQDNAILHLAAVLSSLQDTRLPAHPSATLSAFLEAVAVTQEPAQASLLRQICDPQRGNDALAQLSLDTEFKAELDSLLRNTASVTMLQAGSKINVIPATATAWIDGRLAPGQTQESFLIELRKYIGEEVKVEIDQYSPPLEASADSTLYRTIETVMQEREPDVPLIPFLSTGGTDAKHICPRRPDTQIYGFMPYRQTPGLEEMKLIHGHDERTSVDNLVFATQVLYEIVCRFCTDQTL